MEALQAPIDVSHFDLNRPHKRVTGEKGTVTIVQNGFIYSYSIPNPRMPNIGGKVIGKVADMKPTIVAQGLKFCDFCGDDFGLAEGLERHLYMVHRDSLLVSLIQERSRELRVGELPSEDLIRSEATRIVTGKDAEDALNRQAEKDADPAVAAHKKNKANKKGAYREPLKA